MNIKSSLSAAIAAMLPIVALADCESLSIANASEFFAKPVSGATSHHEKTAALQSALDSDAKSILLDSIPGGWSVGALVIRRSNIEIILKNGVSLSADDKAALTHETDFIKAYAVSNVVIRAEGTAGISAGDKCRHAFSAEKCSGISISNVKITGGGFDTLHFAATRDILLENVEADGGAGNALFIDGADDKGNILNSRYLIGKSTFRGRMRPVRIENMTPASSIFKFSQCIFDARAVEAAAVSMAMTRSLKPFGGFDFGSSRALVDKGLAWDFSGGPGAGLQKMGSGWLYEEHPRHSRLLTGSTLTKERPYNPDEAVPLPGEDSTVRPLPPFPFPDRFSAYVWRNWGLVPKSRLAAAIGATEADVTKLATEMGLESDPQVLPDWKTTGYITIVRRNWHLLNYTQLLKLLGFTRKEFRSILFEHDTLYIKLGREKPACGPLIWTIGDAGETAKKAEARKKLAKILAEEYIDPNGAEEPRFSFKKRLSSPSGSNAPLSAAGKSAFGLRMVMSPFADYGDPLMDPEIGSYPEGLLARYREVGVNAVWLHAPLYMLTTDPKYPEFGVGASERIKNLRKLVERAARYGIKIFFYMNEPRCRPDDFFTASPERAAMKGVSNQQGSAMCISHPESRRWLKSAMKQLFESAPGLGGIFTITASENLTTCAAHGRTVECAMCRKRDPADIIAEANRIMVEGMLEANPDAQALIWDWRWDHFAPSQDPEDSPILRRLAGLKNIRFMTMSERSLPIERAGVKYIVNEYLATAAGPGPRPKKLWNIAKSLGIGTAAKVQPSLSWEFAVAPYLPAMEVAAQHAWNLKNEGVDAVLMSWSLGGAPSPNLRVFDEIRDTDSSWEDSLDRIAASIYGESAAPIARRGWKAFSKGLVEYPFEIRLIRNAPHHWGPANPLYPNPTRMVSTMTGIPYDAVYDWLNGTYTPQQYIEQMDKVAAGFEEGCAQWEKLASASSESGKRLAAEELVIFRAEQLTFASCAEQVRFILARDRGDGKGMAEAAARELENAKAFLPLVRADSSIGFESSNHYFYVPRDVVEKILCCRMILDGIAQK